MTDQNPMSMQAFQADPSAASDMLVAGFRGAMRRLASGVALVTTANGDGTRYGIAMTALMSLSMDPPSLLLAVNKDSSLCRPLLENGRFGVNILRHEDAQVCQHFVAAPAHERFGQADWEDHESGIPLMTTALARVVATLEKAEPFGSHMVIYGKATYVELEQSSDALVYLDGRYGRMTING